MYQRILIPVNGTACSDAALEYGLGLAREQRAGVRIIHVLESPWLQAFEGVPQAYMDAIDSAWQRADRMVSRAVAEARQAGVEGADARLVDANGQRTSDLIAAEAERWSADLIVMGTRGRHGIRYLLLGSIAEDVVRATSVPVLLVHASPAPAAVHAA